MTQPASSPESIPVDTERSVPATDGIGDPRQGGTFLFTMPWDIGAIGGVSQVVKALMEQLAESGPFRPVLAVNEWDQVHPRSVIEDGLERVFLRVRSPRQARGVTPVGVLRYLLALPGHLRTLRSFARREEVRVVNAHFPGLDLLTWFAARWLGGPRFTIVISLHGLEVRSTFGRRGLERRLWSWMLRHADHVVACSDGLRDEVLAEYGLPRERVATIHNGIEIERVAAARAAAGPSDGRTRPYLCSVGTYEPKKAHDVLLHAFQRVAEATDDLDLVMVGRRGETSAATAALIDELGLGERVEMIEDLPHGETLALMGGASAFVLSSRVESFAIVLLEAGALGTPVIATDICGVGELIEDGLHGALVPSENPEALAARILELHDRPDRLRNLGHRLRDHVSSEFRWSTAASRYLDLVGTARPR